MVTYQIEAAYNKNRSRQKQPPRIYGLPRIRKPDTTLEKTVSGVNAFAYDMSAFLANILSPLTSNSNSTVKNSADLSLTIASEKVQDHEIVLSLDEASLFTNVPIDGDVQPALWKLESDADLADRTTLHQIKLRTSWIRSTYFQSTDRFTNNETAQP